MERSRLFEAALAIILIGLGGLLLFAVTSPKAPPAGSWEIAGNGSIDYMLVGSDDTLYAFSGNNVTAMRQDGSVAWTLKVPGRWRILNSWTVPISSSGKSGGGWVFPLLPIIDEHGGNIYLFVTGMITRADIDMANNDVNLTFDHPSGILAISPKGNIAWEYVLPGTIRAKDIRGWVSPEFIGLAGIVSVKASGDRVYLFHDYCEDVLDNDGRLLFTLHNVSAPASVDEKGNIYVIRATIPDLDALSAVLENNGTIIGEYVSNAFETPGYLMPSGIVDAYDSRGHLLWSRDIGERAVRQSLDRSTWQENNMLPLYVNGTLYVPVNNGTAALDTGGNMKWVRHIPDGTFVLFGLMPVDSHGNVYLRMMDPGVGGMYASVLYTITPDGTVSPEPWDYVEWDYSGNYKQAAYPMPVACEDGIAYAIQPYEPITFLTFNESMKTLRYGPDTILAVDVKTGRTLWNFTIPDADKHSLTMNGSNNNLATGWGISPSGSNWETQMYWNDPSWAQQYAHFLPATFDHIQIYPGNGVTYINYDFIMYEYPVIYNISRCIYARGIYAIDDEGRLLWEKPFSGFVDKTAAGNSTIYYLTKDGRLGGNTVSIATGFALAALAYVFLRFFMLGTVARAKSRLDQNDNRNRVLQYVVGHPGATASDMVKGLGMNLGTVRYHLFILTLNHKVVTHQEDDKYLRYFRNAGAYSDAERTMLSLMHREPLRRVLCVLAEKPGLTGSQLAEELNVSATAANRHISLLTEKGVIIRSPNVDRGHVYSIKAEYREYLSRVSDML